MITTTRVVTEKDLDALVRDIARRTQWTRYHTFSSRRSPSGYPDLTLVRGSRLLFVELKSEKGKPTPDQERWLDLLRAVTSVEVHLWRPSSIDAIATTLSPRWKDGPPPVSTVSTTKGGQSTAQGRRNEMDPGMKAPGSTKHLGDEPC